MPLLPHSEPWDESASDFDSPDDDLVPSFRVPASALSRDLRSADPVSSLGRDSHSADPVSDHERHPCARDVGQGKHGEDCGA